MEPRKPGHSPRVGGIHVPPADVPAQRLPPAPGVPDPRGTTSSMLPRADRELLLGWLRRVHEFQIESRALSEQRHAEQQDRHEQLERRVLIVEMGVLRIETLDAKFDNLAIHVRDATEANKRQDEKLLTLEQRRETAAIAGAAAKEESATAVGAANRKWNLRAAAVLVLSALFSACGEAAFAVLKNALK